jgi:glyoxylase-like metal-dependent hydrolase (beta-lactamase superfamily II)
MGYGCQDMRAIDVMHLGRDRVICCWQVGDVLVDPGPASCTPALLRALDGEVPRALLLTHIHLDHAGGTGALIERWPQLPVFVHERGARHLVDPSRLVASATRLYGADMERLWGAILPVPEANVRALGDGAAGPPGFRWAATPGHAVHHVAYLHEATGTALTGDVAGVRIGDGPLLPPTPPPDIDLVRWHASIELIAGWDAAALALTHYGRFTDVDDHLTRLHERLDAVDSLARQHGEAGFAAAMRDMMVQSDEADAYLLAMPPETLFGGLARWWQTRDTPPST